MVDFFCCKLLSYHSLHVGVLSDQKGEKQMKRGSRRRTLKELRLTDDDRPMRTQRIGGRTLVRPFDWGRWIDPRGGEGEGHSRALPAKRGECLDQGVKRPCPYLSCRHHLGREMREHSLRLSSPFSELLDRAGSNPRLRHTCSLDVADNGLQTRDFIGLQMGISKSGVAEIEAVALARISEDYPEITAMLRRLKDVY